MAISDLFVRVFLMGEHKGFDTSMDEAALSAEEKSKLIAGKMDEASTKVGGAFSRIGQSIENFTGIPVAGAMEKMGSKFEEADTKGQKFSQAMNTLGGAALLGVVAAAGAVGYESIEMADKFDTAQAMLQVAVKNSGNSFDKFKPQIQNTYDEMANLGYNSTETAQALVPLITATGKPAVAMKDMAVAASLARYKNEDLVSASQQLAKVLGGNTRLLVQMGINLDIGTGKLSSISTASQALTNAQTKLRQVQLEVNDGTVKGVTAQIDLQNAQTAVSDAAEKLHKDQSAISTVMATLSDKTNGAAKAYGQTLAGQMSIARAQIHNVETEIGEKLIPILAKAADYVAKLISWFEKHRAVAQALAIALGTVLTAAIVSWAATTVAALAGVDVAMGGLPLIIGGLVVAAVWLAANWSRVWSDIKNWVADGVNWVKSHLMLVIGAGGPIGLMVVAIVELGSHWQVIWAAIQSAVQTAWSIIKPIFDAIKQGVQDVTGAINDVTSIGSKLTGAGAKALSFVTGGFLANGGPAMAGTPYVVGENGPELFIPGASGTVIPNNVAFGQTNHSVSTNVNAGQTINITINGYQIANPQQLVNELGWHLRTKVAA